MRFELAVAPSPSAIIALSRAIPLLITTAEALGVDPVCYGIPISINLQTSFRTPPLGVAPSYLRSVAPCLAARVERRRGVSAEGIATDEIYVGSAAFVAINAVVLAIVVAFPGLVLHEAAVPVVDPATVDSLIDIAPTSEPEPPDASGDLDAFCRWVGASACGVSVRARGGEP